MEATTEGPLAPRWLWASTFGSAILAVVSHVVGATGTESVTGILTGIALAGIGYLLYAWGQRREPPSDDTDDGEERRRKEMKAEAGGYGGNGGGL